MQFSNSQHFNLKIEVFENVYPPAEDTYQTIYTIDKVFNMIINKLRKYSRILIFDVGSGTGILTVYTCILLLSRGVKNFITIAVDVDREAILNTLVNVRKNLLSNYVDIVQTSTLRPFRRISNNFSIVISNPPYLPPLDPSNIDFRTEAMDEGRTVIDEIISYIAYLRPGITILTQSSLSNYELTIRKLKLLNYEVVIFSLTHYLFEDIATFAAFLTYVQ